MRLNIEELIELQEVLSEDSQYFCVLRVPQNGESRTFKIAISEKSYLALKRIFYERPFDKTPGLKYRYFWSGAHSKKNIQISIVQGDRDKSFNFAVPQDLIQNLHWFQINENLGEADHLEIGGNSETKLRQIETPTESGKVVQYSPGTSVMAKKILLSLGIILVVAIAGILILAANKPDTFTYQRSMLINAPREKIFDQVIDFHNWTKWSPYEHKDPNLKRTFSGAESGVGSKYAWEGNDEVGAGNMEITQAKKPTSINIGLHFIKPFQGDNNVVFSMVPQGDQTEVTWSMTGSNPFMCKVMGTFMDIEKMCCDDFTKGLTNLKNYIEKGESSDPKESSKASEPEIQEAQPASEAK